MTMAMAMAASSLFSPVLPHTEFSPTLHFTKSKNSIFPLSCSSPKSIPVTEQQVLQAIADSDGKNLPCVRTYENDLSQLTLVGIVDFQQALTASAADGGQVASDHIDAGMEAMVVETVFPVPSSDRATVSTRLVPASFSISSSNDYLISVLAEAICMSALQSTQSQFLDKTLGGNRNGFIHWFRKHESVQSKDSAVILSKLFEDEIVENARSLLDNYNSMKDSFKTVKIKSGHWWRPSCYEKLEKIGGSGFSAWASEYVPAYRLEIDTKIMGDAKIEGWKKSAAGNRWEVVLTHSQMVQLAETLDIYYVDPYSLPDKQLSCGMAAKFANVPHKTGNSFPKLLSVTLASGIFLVAISALGQFCLPWLCKERKQSVEHRSLPSSDVKVTVHDFLDATKLGEYCVLAITKVKSTFGWSDEIKVEDDFGVWIGELPAYLRVEGVDTLSTSSENINADEKVPIQDIASYQVVFSSEGKIIGFQPLSRVAVNHWAANPLAKELYRGKRLSPSIIEPGLKVSLPEKVIVVELLMSINPDAYFALARPFR